MALQRSFSGLSDHIGRYEGGNVRQELSPVLQPIFSAEDFVNPYEWLRVSATLTAIGQAVVFSVPEGELWRVRSLHCQWVNAGGNSAVQAVINPDGVGLLGLENLIINLNPGGTTGFAGTFFTPDPVVIKGAQSAQLGYALAVLISGSANIDLVVSRQRIKI